MATVLLSKEFSLKWNNFSNNLTSGFLSHLSENNLVDVTLAVEGQLLTAHKLILSICSPYFKDIFKKNPCQHPVIILNDMKHTQIEALLKFMYQGEVNINQDDLPTFLKVAQTLQIKGLEGSEGQIMPFFNDYVNASEEQFNKSISLLEIKNKQDNKKRISTESVYPQKLIQKNAKKRKKHVFENEDSIKETNANNNDQICLLSNDDTNIANSKDDNIVYENDMINDNSDIIELTDEQNAKENLTQSVVKPVMYKLSARGRPQLVHEGYVYNLTSRSTTLNRSYYRCAEQHRGCRGKCSVIAESFMPTGVHNHNHPPDYQLEYNYRKKNSLDTNVV